jgi:hypothetical protein
MAARLMLDERHVLAAPAKGIISGRRPATLLRWGQAGAWCCAAAACSMIHEPIARVWPRRGWCWEQDASAAARSARQIRGDGARLWLALEFRRVEEWEARWALRYDVVPCGRPWAAYQGWRGRGREGLHDGRTHHLRAAGRPSCWPMGLWASAIWGGRRAAPAIGRPVAERLPEIVVQPPLPAPACNGTREPTTCSIRIRHLHPPPGPRHTANGASAPTRRLQPPARCPACASPACTPSASHLRLRPLCAHRTHATASSRARTPVRGSVPPRRIAPKREPSLHPSDRAPLPRLGSAQKKHSSPHHRCGPPRRL